MSQNAGMLSASNLRELDVTNLRFIVGSQMTKASNDPASHFPCTATRVALDQAAYALWELDHHRG